MKPLWRKWFGSRSERAAARYLKSVGMRVLAKNYRCTFGELDLIALEAKTVVFVEVRSTEGYDHSRVALSVDHAKQRQLTRLAIHFLQKRRLLGQAARFDVLAIRWPAGRREPEVVHHRDAFEATGAFQLYQ